MKDLIRAIYRNNQLYLITYRRVYKKIPREEVDKYKNVIYFLGVGPTIEF